MSVSPLNVVVLTSKKTTHLTPGSNKDSILSVTRSSTYYCLYSSSFLTELPATSSQYFKADLHIWSLGGYFDQEGEGRGGWSHCISTLRNTILKH